MKKRLLKLLIGIVCFGYWVASIALAAPSDQAQSMSGQIQLLKNRYQQAKNEFSYLQYQENHPLTILSIDRVNKQMLNQSMLDITAAKANLDGITIELTESEQAALRLEKAIQESTNQNNMIAMFKSKTRHPEQLSHEQSGSDLLYQNNLLVLENSRVDLLKKLQSTTAASLQLYKLRYVHIDTLLKSHSIMQLKEKQARSEVVAEQQQQYWLSELNHLYGTLKQNGQSASPAIERDIFFANENLNYAYLRMLLADYQEQVQQLKVSITQSTSISLLNGMSEQVQLLEKQVIKMSDLLKKRAAALAERKVNDHNKDLVFLQKIDQLNTKYQDATKHVANLRQDVSEFRANLDHALQQEISSRQGIPGFSMDAWMGLGEEFFLLPTLVLQVIKNVVYQLTEYVSAKTWVTWSGLLALECLWLVSCYMLSRLLVKITARFPDHEYGHINLKWLILTLAHRNATDIGLWGGFLGALYMWNIPNDTFDLLMHLGMVWLFFKTIIQMSRLCLVETIHDSEGHDVRLYHRLKWSFLLAGFITVCMVFLHHLPLVFKLKDLFDRLFLFCMLIVSLSLIRSSHVLPSLILLHIHERHTYFKKAVRLFGKLIPIILLANAVIGLLGYVNLVLTMSWYESVFLCVLIAYVVIRGFLNDALEFASNWVIQHGQNGWLWTEAVLKPLDKVLGIILSLAALAMLFLFYGWDQQSPVVEQIDKIFHYHLADAVYSNITLINVLKTIMVISSLFWAARWVREFVYRFLLSRTEDLGLRNSIATFSQYAVVFAGIFICLRLLGIDFKVLSVIAGILALGIGFGLRDLANNYVSGFLLLIERPLRVGDIVTINEHEGEVMHIGVRAVTVRTWDLMDVLVPNADIFSKLFVNWTAQDDIVRASFPIKVHRHDQPDYVQKIMYEALAAQQNVLKQPESEVYLVALVDGLLEFEVRYYLNLRRVKSRFQVRSEILMAIWDAFAQHGIKPAYPHHEVNIQGERMVSLVAPPLTYINAEEAR